MSDRNSGGVEAGEVEEGDGESLLWQYWTNFPSISSVAVNKEQSLRLEPPYAVTSTHC